MLVFGGYGGYDTVRGDIYFNDLWSYQVASNRWELLTPSDTPPPTRSGHTAVWDAVGNRMLVFGGYGGYDDFFGDLKFNDLCGATMQQATGGSS
jgi:hypothetical protein